MFQYELKQKLSRALDWQLEKASLFEVRLVDPSGLVEKNNFTAKRLKKLVAQKSNHWLRHFVQSMFIDGSVFFYKQRSPLLNDFALEDLLPLPSTGCTMMLSPEGQILKIDCDSPQPLVLFDSLFGQGGTLDPNRCVFYVEQNPYGNSSLPFSSPAHRVMKCFENKKFGIPALADEIIMQHTNVHPYFFADDWSASHPEMNVSALAANGLEFAVAPLVSRFVGMLNRHLQFHGDFYFEFEYKGDRAARREEA